MYDRFNDPTTNNVGKKVSTCDKSMFVLVEVPDSLDTKGELDTRSVRAVYEHQGRILTTCIKNDSVYGDTELRRSRGCTVQSHSHSVRH
jgi:hypothetical protein